MDLIAKGDRVWLYFQMNGHHTGPWFGLPGDGQPISVHENAYLTFKDNKIIEARFEVEELLLAGLEVREDWQIKSGLDSRSFALVKVAVLIALDAPPASYLWQVANALDAGATPADLLGVLYAVAPQVGGPKVVAAAPELMVALGLSLPDGQ